MENFDERSAQDNHKIGKMWDIGDDSLNLWDDAPAVSNEAIDLTFDGESHVDMETPKNGFQRLNECLEMIDFRASNKASAKGIRFEIPSVIDLDEPLNSTSAILDHCLGLLKRKQMAESTDNTDIMSAMASLRDDTLLVDPPSKKRRIIVQEVEEEDDQAFLKGHNKDKER